MNTISIKRWIWSTSLGWLLSVVFIILLSGIFDSVGIHGYQCYVGIGVGMGVGFMQWVTLKKRAGFGNKWLWYTIIGVGTPFLLFDLLKHLGHYDFGDHHLLYSVSLAGLSVGIMQSLILRRYTSKAVIWIPVNFIAWIAAGLTVLAIDHTRELIKPPLWGFIANLSLILAGGVVLGIITGLALKRIK
ncbi:MAG: hypothetical protein BGO70_12070 [Bacteroidetes bacterium 43-93]|nr:hypothetical protein [Bacteroidota bacterium]OJW98192.1 MAG: hypothetical protein BGO70_12070 [Bacteroidetes bacterium 43-93]